MELAIELAMNDSDDNSTLLEAEIQKTDDAHTIGLKLQGAISTVLSGNAKSAGYGAGGTGRGGAAYL